ncbi:MAG: DUF4294 domain-containing protein [Bacteroidales bacterium]|nr:DUF4294 domain-containing protein [Bacteroidales bacterium]
MNRVYIKILTGSILVFFFYLQGIAQGRDSAKIMIGIIDNGDTIIHRNLKEVVVMPELDFRNPRQERKFHRYIEKVKKVYPYAKLAGEVLREYEPKYLALQDDRARRKMMKELEQQLLREYKDDIKKFTISEGRILLKLIDREARRTSYALIKEFRGGFSAFFWQSIARIFGGDLKVEYDPYGEDKVLEHIVMLIEIGYY